MDIVSLDVLEEACSRLWGPTQFDWVLGRTIADDGRQVWFWYCGAAFPFQWRHKGQADTISGALMAMINLGKERDREPPASHDSEPS